MMDTRQRLESLRKLQHLLDNAFRVPGTSLRFGWDPIIGAVPWVGDVLAALLSCAIVVQAHHMRVPRVVQARMLLNTAIDVLDRVVPVVGDVADVFWKSNAKNFLLLERHAAEAQPATAGRPAVRRRHPPRRGRDGAGCRWLWCTGCIDCSGLELIRPIASA